MNAPGHHPGTYPLTAAQKAGARLVRLTAVLAAITGSLLVTVAGVPAAFARVPATITHVITTGGMADWQIALIALAAALVAVITAVFVDRARTVRRDATGA